MRRLARHSRNLGYGAGMRSAFNRAIESHYDGLVTIDCDGQHEPSLIPMIASRLHEADIVSGSRYLQVFDPSQVPPEQRRRINVEVTRWINDCLGYSLTDAFCGDHLNEDPLIFPSKENPFKEKKGCELL